MSDSFGQIFYGKIVPTHNYLLEYFCHYNNSLIKTFSIVCFSELSGYDGIDNS
jgi:hypothetical protein